MGGGGLPFVWFHNGRPLVHGSKSSAGLGLVSVFLEGVSESDASKRDWMAWTSRLVIQRADPADSGNYTCVPWRGKAASVNVFVSQGELRLFTLSIDIGSTATCHHNIKTLDTHTHTYKKRNFWSAISVSSTADYYEQTNCWCNYSVLDAPSTAINFQTGKLFSHVKLLTDRISHKIPEDRKSLIELLACLLPMNYCRLENGEIFFGLRWENAFTSRLNYRGWKRGN